MKVFTNTPFKNEAWLFSNTLKFWDKYPVDKFVFIDDNSVDNGREIILDVLGRRAEILKLPSKNWHESMARSLCWEYSRANDVDVIISIDADELLCATVLDNWDELMRVASKKCIMCPQINIVSGTLKERRADPAYKKNVRDFIHPVATSGKFPKNAYYHSQRMPSNSASSVLDDNCSFFHLQAADKDYYALKQLWYKFYERKEYGFSIMQINSRYDLVVNNLNFDSIDVDKKYYNGIDLDLSFYKKRIYNDDRFKQMYRWYQSDSSCDELITFGRDIFNKYRKVLG